MTKILPLKKTEILSQISAFVTGSEELETSARESQEARRNRNLQKTEVAAQTRDFLATLPIGKAERLRIEAQIVELIAPAALARTEAEAMNRKTSALLKALARLDADLYPLQSQSFLIAEVHTALRVGLRENPEDLGNISLFLRLGKAFTEKLGVSSRESWIAFRDFLKTLTCSLERSLRALKSARRWLAPGSAALKDVYRLLKDLRESLTIAQRLRHVGRFWAGQMSRSKGGAACAAAVAHRAGIKHRLAEIAVAIRAMKAVRQGASQGTASLDAALRDLKDQYRSLAAQRHLGRDATVRPMAA